MSEQAKYSPSELVSTVCYTDFSDRRTSHEAGMLYEFRGVKGEGNSVDKIRSSLENRMKWIWQYDLPSAIDECIARL